MCCAVIVFNDDTFTNRADDEHEQSRGYTERVQCAG